jgi:TatD DNase family protein
MLRFVDSHAHIFYEEYRADLDEVLARAASAGVAGIVCPGTNLETSRQSVALAGADGAGRAAVGFHRRILGR